MSAGNGLKRFELTERTLAKLTNVNLRDEKHGDEPVTAMDLKFVVSMSAVRLAMFHDDLCNALYERLQQVIDGVEATDESLSLRFPKLAPLRYEHELTGATLQHHGTVTTWRLNDVKVNKFGLIGITCGSVHDER